MSSRTTKITIRVVEVLEPNETIWDSGNGSVAGFGVRRQRRDPFYVLKARIGARQRWFTIGKHGTWTVDQARREARAVLGEIARGHDPAGRRDTENRTPTMDAVADRFFDEEIAPKRAAATAVLYRDLWDRLGKSNLGKRKVSEVNFRDIADVHYKLRNTPITANRLVAVISSMFSWCERQGLRPRQSNPTIGIEKFKEKSRERFLSPCELANLGTAMAEAEERGTESIFVLAAIRLLMLTGCRRNEILKLRWQDVRADQAMLFLPDTKTGARPVYLSAPALTVLSSLPRAAGNPYVIVGERKGRHLVNLRKPWLRISTSAGLIGVRIHDLRHSFASVGVSGGASLPIIGKLLGHTKSSTTEKYSHLSADPVRQVNESIGEAISDSLAANSDRLVATDADS